MDGRVRRKGKRGFRSVFRELLMSVLYQWEFRKGYESIEDVLDSFLKNRRNRFVKALRERAREIVEVNEELEHIIRENSQYPYEKMDLIDKVILKIAIFEMIYKGIPPEVSISEAVKLSLKYSSPNSYRFVNAVLGQVSRDVCSKGS